MTAQFYRPRRPIPRHRCQATACGTSILRRYVLCKTHWQALPEALRHAVRETRAWINSPDPDERRAVLRARRMAIEAVQGGYGRGVECLSIDEYDPAAVNSSPQNVGPGPTIREPMRPTHDPRP